MPDLAADPYIRLDHQTLNGAPEPVAHLAGLVAGTESALISVPLETWCGHTDAAAYLSSRLLAHGAMELAHAADRVLDKPNVGPEGPKGGGGERQAGATGGRDPRD